MNYASTVSASKSILICENIIIILQVAPYERPALSKGYLLPEGIIRVIRMS